MRIKWLVEDSLVALALSSASSSAILDLIGSWRSVVLYPNLPVEAI